MSKFLERLQQAAKFAGVGHSQAAIADSLGIKRQTVNRWFRDGIEPSADNCFDIAAKWGVDGRWLKKGEGEMLPTPGGDLPQDVRDIVREVLRTTPQRRKMVLNMVRALRKTAVTIAAVIPPLLAPSPSDAKTSHNLFSAPTDYTLRRKWLSLRPNLA